MTNSIPAAPESPAPVRLWAAFTLFAHIVFVLAWLIAAAWQGPRYSAMAHSISDMYAVTAPHGMVLVVILTLCGLSLVLFTALTLWPMLRRAGWSAAVGCLLLALSIFGLGDLLSPFERLACRLADPGCSALAQVANAGGALDSTVSFIGICFLIGAGFFLAAAMGRLAAWRTWAAPTRWFTALIIVFFLLTGLTGGAGLSGLFERLLAFTGAAGIVALALKTLRRWP